MELPLPGSAPTSAAATVPAPPLPGDQDTVIRWTHTRLRRRLLYGGWHEDLLARIKTAIGTKRQAAWGNPDLSSNVFRSSVTQLAALYDRPPAVWHDDATAAALITEVSAAGLWPMMQRVQRDCLGMREVFVRVDVVDGELVFRPAFADLVEAEARPEFPDRPVRYREAFLRRDPDTRRLVWTFDEFDIRDGVPVWRVTAAEGDKTVDLSATYLVDAEGKPAPEGGFRGEAYPFRYADGTPFIPAVLYHAARTGALFDAYEAIELVEGALNIGVLWTMFSHCVRNASWPQRYTVNARLPAGSEGTTSDNQRDAIVTDPVAVIELESDEDKGGQPVVGQWGPASQPGELEEAIARYERRVAAFAGISPADVQRVAGDPRSGFALAISREGQREAQRRYEPVFRRGDEELLAKAAALRNRYLGKVAYPEGGYRLAYEAIPMSADELEARRRDLLERLDAGLIDIVTAYQAEHPGVSREDAERQLVEIERINRSFRPSRPAAV